MEPAGGSLPLVQVAFYWGSCLQLAWLTLAPPMCTRELRRGLERLSRRAAPSRNPGMHRDGRVRWAGSQGTPTADPEATSEAVPRPALTTATREYR